MTPAEMERVMNFIIERQETFASQMSEQQLLIGSLIESQNTLTATVQQTADAHSTQITDTRASLAGPVLARSGVCGMPSARGGWLMSNLWRSL